MTVPDQWPCATTEAQSAQPFVCQTDTMALRATFDEDGLQQAANLDSMLGRIEVGSA